MKQVLPMISIGTFGIVNIPTKVSDYKAKLVRALSMLLVLVVK